MSGYEMELDRIVARLDAVDVSDPEMAHCEADELLCAALRSAGLGPVADAYDRVVARARWWAAA